MNQDIATKFAAWLANKGIPGAVVEFDPEDPTISTVTFLLSEEPTIRRIEDEDLWITFYEDAVVLYNEGDGILEHRSATSDNDKLVAAMDFTEL